jgi:hypothetical protein
VRALIFQANSGIFPGAGERIQHPTRLKSLGGTIHGQSCIARVLLPSSLHPAALAAFRYAAPSVQTSSAAAAHHYLSLRNVSCCRSSWTSDWLTMRL